MKIFEVLKKMSNRKKMFEEYIHQIKTPARIAAGRRSLIAGNNKTRKD